MAEAEQMSLSVAVLLYSDKILLIGTGLILEFCLYKSSNILYGKNVVRACQDTVKISAGITGKVLVLQILGDGGCSG